MRLSLPGSVSSVMVWVGVGILRLLGWSVFRGNIQIFIFSCHCHPSLTTSKVNTPRQLYLNQDFFLKRKSHLAVPYLSFLSLSYPGSQYWVNHQTEISNIGSLLLSSPPGIFSLGKFSVRCHSGAFSRLIMCQIIWRDIALIEMRFSPEGEHETVCSVSSQYSLQSNEVISSRDAAIIIRDNVCLFLPLITSLWAPSQQTTICGLQFM